MTREASGNRVPPSPRSQCNLVQGGVIVHLRTIVTLIVSLQGRSLQGVIG